MNNTINGRTPDEIKLGMECCTHGTCNSCPYAEDGCGTNQEMIDALEYIQQLENYIGELTENVAQLEEECDLLIADLRKAYEELPDPPKEDA